MSESARENGDQAPTADGRVLEHLTSARSVFSSTRWSAAGKLSVQAIRFGAQVALTRLLADPSDPRHAAAVIGTIAMALLVREFMDMLCDFGFGQAVIQRPALTDRFLNSTFFLNLCFGLALSATLALAAPLVAGFLGEPELTPILRLLSLSLLINSSTLVHRGLLRRSMRFDFIAKLETIEAALFALIAVTLVYNGWEEWGLAWGIFIASACSAATLWFTSPWRPDGKPYWSQIKATLPFAAGVSGSGLVGFSGQNLHRFIVGHLGSQAMGYYDWTGRIVLQPMTNVSRTLLTVLTSAFSRMQNDDAQIREKFLRATACVALITFPAMAGLAALARPLVVTVLGSDWAQISPLITIICATGVIQSLSYTVSSIYIAKGRTDWLFKWTVASVLVLALANLIGLQWGVTGVASGLSIAYVTLAYPAFAIPFRLIELRFGTMLRRLSPYAIAASLMAGCVLGLRVSLENLGSHDALITGAGIASGVVVYGVLIWILRPAAVAELATLVGLPEQHVLRSRFKASGSDPLN